MKSNIFTFFFLILGISIQAQINLEKKTVRALRTTDKITIDGKLDEGIWAQAEVAGNFVQIEPVPDTLPTFDTEVKILYDDKAIYLGAFMHDDDPDAILKELVERDESGNASFFAVVFDPYKSGQSGSTFIVTAAGVQIDLKESDNNNNNNNNGNRKAWDAVWDSKVSFVENGWIAELKIPYSALRFPEVDIQSWAIQFGRNIRRFREQNYWSRVNPEVGGFTNQLGVLEGIENIKPPIRLSVTPYVTGYLNNSYDPSASPKSNWGTSYNAGMDLKYGINDAFTLDMTLIPDFGQTQSDDLELNLGPFEQFFEEKRAFFTEGIELFNKSGIFYSRRVGGYPVNADAVEENLADNEVVDKNPSTTGLYNATKITGRTSKGLGIGFFNAVSGKEHATILDTISGTTRSFETSPLTNYNAFVFDQNLKNNSSVTFTNTNVLRQGDTYDANVTAINFNLKTKDQNWVARGGASVSQKYYKEQDDEFGHKANVEVGKASGKLTYSISFNQESDNYDPNDLGFLFSPNERLLATHVRYEEYKPNKYLNRWFLWLWTGRQSLYKPNEFTWWEFNFGGFGLSHGHTAFGFSSSNNFIHNRDFFEPRTSDFSAYYKQPKSISFRPWLSTDYRKTFALDLRLGMRHFFDTDDRINLRVTVEPRIRLSDRFSIINEITYLLSRSQDGFADQESVSADVYQFSDSDILFGTRDRKTIINVLSLKYSFSCDMSLKLRARYNWDRVNYKSFGTLTEDGSLNPIAFDGNNEFGEPIFDSNFTIFNVDLEYKWRFAPGSDMIFVWKSQIFNSDSEASLNFSDNFNRLWDQRQDNSLSLRFIYYLDYLSVFGS